MRAKIIATKQDLERIGLDNLNIKDQFFEVEEIEDGDLHRVEINNMKWSVPTRLLEFEFGRDEFMEFFRNIERLNELSVDDRIEVFSTILLGSSDFTAELLNDIFNDYCVDTLDVVEYPYNFDLEVHQKELKQQLRVMETIINVIDESTSKVLNKENYGTEKWEKHQRISNSLFNLTRAFADLKELLDETN